MLLSGILQGSNVMPFPGLVNFVSAVAYHFSLNLIAAFSQPGNGLIVEPCILYSADTWHHIWFMLCRTYVHLFWGWLDEAKHETTFMQCIL